MEAPPHLTLTAADWLALFGHFALLSLMSVGGALSTSSEMHRFLVARHGWLTGDQFADSIALAQAAPGPNVLFVALLGWQLGLNAGGTALALLGVLVTMVGLLAPSTVLTCAVAAWGHRNRELRAVRAFRQGMAPVVIALLLSTAWTLAASSSPGSGGGDWPLWLLAGGAGLLVWRTRVHMLWLMAGGALLGAAGFV